MIADRYGSNERAEFGTRVLWGDAAHGWVGMEMLARGDNGGARRHYLRSLYYRPLHRRAWAMFLAKRTKL